MNYLKRFENHVQKTCSNYKIKLLKQKRGKLLINSIPLNGYFSASSKELAFTYLPSSNDWIEILVHEFSHMLQFINNKDEYMDFEQISIIFDDWLNKKIELSDDKLNNLIKKIALMEQDADKIAVSLIRDYRLDIDIDNYIQKANAYHLFYFEVMKIRKWYTIGNEPYNNFSLIKNMPKIFIKL